MADFSVVKQGVRRLLRGLDSSEVALQLKHVRGWEGIYEPYARDARADTTGGFSWVPAPAFRAVYSVQDRVVHCIEEFPTWQVIDELVGQPGWEGPLLRHKKAKVRVAVLGNIGEALMADGYSSERVVRLALAVLCKMPKKELSAFLQPIDPNRFLPDLRTSLSKLEMGFGRPAFDIGH